jgi:hypothetical protein
MEKINSMINVIENTNSLNEKITNINNLNILLKSEKTKLKNINMTLDTLEGKKSTKYNDIEEIQKKFNKTDNIEKKIKLYQNILYLIEKEIKEITCNDT